MASNEDEKLGSQPSPTEQSASSSTLEAPSWDASLEAQARRKVDLSVLPLLFLGLLVFQIDRMNLASALTDHFETDVGVSQATVNMVNQLMFMGIVVWEIPCNMALQWIGPRKWMSAQVFVFGFIPGAIYTLSTWYKRRELAKRVAIFFFGMFGGNAVSPLLASGILQMDGVRGIRGWKWLFLIEGLFTIWVSLLLLFFLPGSPDEPRPLLSPGLVRFSQSEQEVLQNRLENDDGEDRRGAKGLKIPLDVIWRTVSHYRRWPHFVSTFVVFSTWSPLTTYTPSIIMSLGFDRTKANALAAVGAFLALGVVFLFAYLSDGTNRRGGTVIAAQVCYLVTLIVAHQLQPHVGKWSRWGLWTAVNAFSVGYHPVHNSWVQLNCQDLRERSISIAMWVMSAISGLMVGAQYFQAGDAPLYENGLRIMVIMVSIGIASAALQIVVYVVHNKRVAEGKQPKDGSTPIIYTP